MAETKKIIPKRRFKDFQNAEAWGQCKLGEHATFRRGSFPQPYGNNEWYDGEGAMPFIQVVDVTKQLNLVDNTKQKISIKAQPSSVFIPKGKVIVTLQGSIGRVAITQYDAYMDRTLLLFESYKHKTDQRFWAYIIQQKFEIEKQRAPGGTIKTITKEALAKFEISLPNYDEQEKIGSFLKSIDNLITLHQRKLDKIKSTKKAYLYEMFPAEGESKPKRRFKGFTDDWKLCDLGDIADVIDPHPSHRAPEKKELGIPFIGIGDVDEVGKINYKTARIVDEMIYDEHQKRYDLTKKSIGIGRVASLGKVIRLREDIGKYAISPTMAVVQFDKNTEVDYAFAFMNTPLFQYQFTAQSNGSTRQSVGIQDLRKLGLAVPPNMREQKCIGALFLNIDNLITLHQHKLDKLKNLKKSYLNEMFI